MLTATFPQAASHHCPRNSSTPLRLYDTLLTILPQDRGIPESRIARKLDSIAVLSPERQARDGGTKLLDAESRQIHHVRWRTYQREAISDGLLDQRLGVVATFIDCAQECLTTQNDRPVAFVYFVACEGPHICSLQSTGSIRGIRNYMIGI
jgi:hypothetical protein